MKRTALEALVKTVLATLALGALAAGSLALAQTPSTNSGQATTTPSITYPIAALGGCTDKASCKVYCDNPAHRDACFTFAGSHGLMNKDEIDRARAYLKQLAASSTAQTAAATTSIDAVLNAGAGPGACTTREACKAFCDDPAHATVCLQFAKEHKLMTTSELSLAKKLQSQVGPGGCQGVECKQYCNDPSHEQVCVAFAQQNNFISKEDAARHIEHLNLATTSTDISTSDSGQTLPASNTPPPQHTARRGDGRLSTSSRQDAASPSDTPPQAAASTSDSGTNTPPPPRVEAPQGTNPDMSQPPYHCTQAQADEGACEPPSDASGQGGSIFYAVLHFFGF